MASRLIRYYTYQKERFPIGILIFTTLAVVLSSAAVIIGQGSIKNSLGMVIIGAITSLLFTFHMRVLDEWKDLEFDKKHHSNRPIQRGIVTLKELFVINIFALIVQVVLNIFFPIAFLWWMVAFIYSFIAGQEFFMRSWIRKRFFLYNFLNLLQLFFLQIYLYALFDKNFSWADQVIFIHFIFVIGNVSILEFGRKLKIKSEETAAKDTYSSRLGIKKAASSYFALCVIVYILFVYLLLILKASLKIFLFSILPLGIVVLSTPIYLLQRKNSSKILELFTLIFYLSLHFLLVFTRW